MVQVVQVVRVASVVRVVLVIKFVNAYGLHGLNNQVNKYFLAGSLKVVYVKLYCFSNTLIGRSMPKENISLIQNMLLIVTISLQDYVKARSITKMGPTDAVLLHPSLSVARLTFTFYNNQNRPLSLSKV